MHMIICNLYFRLFIYHCFLLIPMQFQSMSVDWQSSTNLSTSGFEFSPVDQQALLLFETTTNSLIACTRTCHSNGECRIFDFDNQSQRCRLFEGNIVTMGSIITSSSTQSRVGSIKLDVEQFINRGQPCSYCQGSRYLTCNNGTCQCQPHTYFDGSICESQKLLGADCNNNTECRLDLNYTCLPRQQCGMPSMQTAIAVGGNSNGTSGSTLSTLYFPTGISVGTDNSLYVSDYNNNRVMKFQGGSSIGSIVCGTGISGNSFNQLNGPTGLYVDTSFNIYVVDKNNYRIMFWSKNSSIGIKVAGSGLSGNTLSSFSTAAGLFVDSQGNIYLCDAGNHRVMKFSPNVNNSVILAGTGVPGSSSYQLNTPYGIYFDEISSYLYVADYNNHRIQRYHVGVSTNGSTVAGGNGAGRGSNQLKFPYSLWVSKITNAIYISDSGNNRIQCWSSGATSGVTVAGNGALISNASTPLQGTMDIKLSVNDTYLFVSEMSYNIVWRFQLI